MPDLSFDIRASVWGEAPPQDLVGMASNLVSFPSVLASKGLRQNVWCISGSAKGAVTGGYGT